MRVTIVHEGTENYGMFVEKGAITWSDEPLPLIPHGDHSQILGRVSDIRREDDGRITGEITMKANEKDQYSALLSPAEFDRPWTPDVKDRKIVSGRLRCVSWVPWQSILQPAEEVTHAEG